MRVTSFAGSATDVPRRIAFWALPVAGIALPLLCTLLPRPWLPISGDLSSAAVARSGRSAADGIRALAGCARMGRSGRMGCGSTGAVKKMMTYLESAEGETITKERALRELKAHGVPVPEGVAAFLQECGDREVYDAGDVLRWLGY